ncbi:sensor histidine kinase [Xenophilus arseniciresistens]|uniref:Sensor histidine kinase n=1 Tax=Xenophilus arseniciresistens TaxID=1283306 RepID=A0AAE3N6B7_9BURK|nr:sensor histidine kinase [Xenophilus arseniciresistens]MDA7415166.1 sensor histidine kinase [Xenophilus arseniciresistens]
MPDARILSTPSRPDPASKARPAASRAPRGPRAAGAGRGADKPHPPAPPQPGRLPPGLLLFDVCQIGMVLRTVLLVQAVVGVGALYMSAGLRDWLLLTATVTGGALPATLAWLVGACTSRRWLGRQPLRLQYLAGALLGLLAGLYGCGLLYWVGVVAQAPWLASALTGALLSAVVMAERVLRASGRTPAATTARLEELQQRIRPHFLFNTLNSAIALVRHEPAKAETLLEDLSELFRSALADPDEAVTLADEIALAERYLAIEQIRFGERLRVRWSLDPAASGARLPKLLLQPLVENAVKHGVEPSPEGGRLRIRTERRGNRVVIEVLNTLPPLRWAEAPLPRGHGIALANVRDRLRLLHDLEASFRAGPEGGESYRVRIDIPIAS